MALLSAADRMEGELKEDRARRLKVWQIPEAHVRFLTKTASGVYGEVWRGSYGGQPVAIKLLKRPLDDRDHLDPSAAADYERENTTLQQIRHPHLLHFVGSGITTSARKPFLVTEFMELGSLRGVLADAGRALDWATVRHRMAAEIAAGMAHLHSLRIVHRDLKSDNCLCDGLLNILNTKVADFGASKLMQNAKTEAREPMYEDSPHPAAWAGVVGATKTERFAQTMTKGAGTPLWMDESCMDG